MKLRSPILRMALRLAFGALLIALLVAFVPTDDLGRALRQMPPWVWIVAPPVYLALHVVGICKWRLLMQSARAHIGWRDAMRAYYHGLFANLFLPSLVGGDLLRVSLAARAGAKLGGVLVGTLAAGLFNLFALTVLAATGAWRLHAAVPGGGATLRAVSLLLLGVAGGSLLALRYFPTRRVPRRLRRTFVDMRRALAALLRRPTAVLAAIALALALQTGLVVLNSLLSLRLGLEIPFVAWLFVWPMAKVSALVPITQGGIGLREAAQVALLTALGFPAVAALAVGLCFQGVAILGALLAGAVAFLLGLGGRGASAPDAAARASRTVV